MDTKRDQRRSPEGYHVCVVTHRWPSASAGVAGGARRINASAATEELFTRPVWPAPTLVRRRER